MQYRTHITVSLAVGLPLMAATDQLTVINTCALVLGSLLPDIDHPKSFIGKHNQLVSQVTNKTLGHRGATHSLVVAFGIYFIFLFIAKKYFSASAMLTPFWTLVGYLLHLVEDSFSKNGIHWFWPLSKKKKSRRKKVFYYRTGQLSEYLVLGFSLCLVLIELKLIISDQLGNLFGPELGMWLTRLQVLLS